MRCNWPMEHSMTQWTVFVFFLSCQAVNGCIMTSLSTPVEDSTTSTLTNRTTDWMADKKTSAAVKRKLSKHVSRECQASLLCSKWSLHDLAWYQCRTSCVSMHQLHHPTNNDVTLNFFHWVHTLSLIIIITTVLFVTQLLFYVNFAFLTGFNSKCSASIADFFMWESPRTLSCALFCCKARRKR